MIVAARTLMRRDAIKMQEMSASEISDDPGSVDTAIADFYSYLVICSTHPGATCCRIRLQSCG